MFSTSIRSSSPAVSPNIIELKLPLPILKTLLKKTLFSVGTGIILLLITVIIASKFKVALIMLPISIYLIAQFFLLNNHIKTIKSQYIQYDRLNEKLIVSKLYDDDFTIDLNSEIITLREVKSVQKNNGINLGYYELKTNSKTVNIPFIVAENPQTKPFFDKLNHFARELETKLFPII